MKSLAAQQFGLVCTWHAAGASHSAKVRANLHTAHLNQDLGSLTRLFSRAMTLFGLRLWRGSAHFPVTGEHLSACACACRCLLPQWQYLEL